MTTLKVAVLKVVSKLSFRQMAHKGHTGTLRYMAPEVVAQRTSKCRLLEHLSILIIVF